MESASPRVKASQPAEQEASSSPSLTTGNASQQRPAMKRIVRPGKPLPSLPPTPTAAPTTTTPTPDTQQPTSESTTNSAASASTGETITNATTSTTPRGSQLNPLNSEGQPNALPPATINSDAPLQQISAAAAADSLASGSSGAKPVIPSRPAGLTPKRPPPVPGRKVDRASPSGSPSVDRRGDEPSTSLSSSSSSASLTSSPSASSPNTTQQPAAPLDTATLRSPRSGGREAPGVSLTPASPEASGEIATSQRSIDESSSATSLSPRAKTSSNQGVALSTSSLLSVFSSSLTGGSVVDDLEKRLKKVKEKKEKLIKELKRLEEEETELEDKLREAREKEEKGEDGGSGRKKGSAGSRRGPSGAAGDRSSTSISPTSLASNTSATASPSLGSSGSAISPSTASSLHRRVGSLVQLNMTKKKKSGSLVLSEKDKEKLAREIEKERERENSSSETTELDLSVPRQFYCKRTGGVTLKANELGTAPPTKKYAREIRRKEVMLYIDSTGVQVMAHEEKTARYPMSDMRNIGWSTRQFFLVVGKPNRANVELLEFKTKEGKKIFDWIMALKKDEREKLAKQTDKEKEAGSQASEVDNEDKKPSPEVIEEKADQQEAPSPEGVPSPDLLRQDRLDVRWSVAFIPPVVLDNDAEEDGDEGSGSTITHASADNVSDNEAEEVPQASTPQKKVDIHRETLLELLATERSYNADLDVIVELWMAKLKESKLVELADLSAIFSNIEQIRNLNKELLNSLDGLDTLPKESLNVGERFQNFIAFLKLYTQYCSNYEVAHARLVALREAKWELTPFLESIQCRRECKNLDLESFLIKPMQRLTKYPLLIQALLKNTPADHPDYDKLARCYDGVQKVVLIVNENKRRNENLTKLMQIQQQFLEPGLKLVEATRKFIREGTFPRVSLGAIAIKNCTVLLFNDIIVLAVKKKNKYQAKSGKITLRGSYVWEDNTTKNGFTVVGREAADKITVEATTEQEKKTWMDEISQALVHLPHNSLLGSSSPSTAEKFVRQAETQKE